MAEMTQDEMNQVAADMRVYRNAPGLLAICKAMQAHLERKRGDYDCGVGVPGAYMRDMDPAARDLWAQLDAAIAEAEGRDE